MSARRLLRRGWDTGLALLAAVCGALWLTPTVIIAITTEVIAFFTIQAAAILPAMIFTAGLLRGQGLTLSEIDRYQAALRRQMYFWITLLFLDVAAVMFVILGKAANWRWKVSIEGYGADLGWILIFIVVFVATLAVLRMVPFVLGVLSLLDLNGLLVRKSVEAAVVEADRKDVVEAGDGLNVPKGYGRILPHPRKPRRTTG